MWEILLSLGLLFANGFFVAAEFALVRVRASQLEIYANEGDKASARVLRVLHDIDAYLSAVQLGITFASLGLGWLAEPAVNRHLTTFVNWLALPLSEEAVHGISFVIAFTLVSFLHIVVGEIAPKSLAIAKPVEISRGVALPMQIFRMMMHPALIVLTATTNGLLRLVNVDPVQAGHSSAMSAEELQNIAQHSSAGGTISQDQGKLLNNVFHYATMIVREIMVPRGKIDAIQSGLSIEEAIDYAIQKGRSRYPVFDENIDDILGVVMFKDLVAAKRSGKDVPVKDLCRKATYVPEVMPISTLVKRLQNKRSHLAVVVDEYGGTAGLVTLEDALEELVGEIDDEFDSASAQPIRQVERGYIVEGSTLLDELVTELDLAPFEAESDTVSGLVMEVLGRVASVEDEITINGLLIRVIQMQKLFISKVFVEMIQDSHVESD